MSSYEKALVCICVGQCPVFRGLDLDRFTNLSVRPAGAENGCVDEWSDAVEPRRHSSWPKRLANHGRNGNGFGLGPWQLCCTGLDGRLAASRMRLPPQRLVQAGLL